MGCISSFGRTILIILNMAFVLVSLALIGVGVVLRFYPNYLIKIMGTLEKLLEDNPVGNTVGNQINLTQLHLPGKDELNKIVEFPFLKEAGIALLVFGCVLFIIAFSACCGACCKSRLLLMVFIILMSVLVLAQAVVGGLFLAKSSPLHEKIKEELSKQMQKQYSYNATGEHNVFSFAINLMNYLLECCGVTGLADFKHGDPVSSCCKRELADNTTLRSKCLTPPMHPPYADFNTEGCYDKLQGWAVSNVVLAADILTLILLLQVILIVFAYLNVKDDNSVGPV